MADTTAMPDEGHAVEPPPQLGAPEASAAQRRLGWLATAVLFYFILKVSWVAEDSYITLRTVDNVLNGYGPRWNVAERVQSYTHPLWMLVLIPFKAALPSSMLALFIPCWLASFVALGRLFRAARSPFGVVAAFCVLGASQSFIDYGTSGLECALSYLLIVSLLGALPSEGGGVTKVAAFFGLALLNRLDLAPLLAPLVIGEVWRSRGRGWLPKVVVALSPLLGWLVFASIYYGSPLPNTYFAKIETSPSAQAVLTQSLRYFLDVALYEPLTLAAALSGLVLGVRGRHVDRSGLYVAIGIALHLAYVLKIGGDYMNARFLVPSVLASAWIALRSADRAAPRWNMPAALEARASFVVVAAAAVLLVASDLHSFTSRNAGALRPSKIADERLFHMEPTGFWSRFWGYLKGQPFEVPHVWANHGRKLRLEQPSDHVFVYGSIGFMGYYAGPGVHFVDYFGLTDAFMARMPIDVFLTAGHGERVVPGLYVESIEQRRNLFPPGSLHDLYDDVMLVTRSKRLLSWRRLVASWRLHTGGYSDVARPRPKVLAGDLEEAVASAGH
jgi:arabinofuranosyltransferase